MCNGFIHNTKQAITPPTFATVFLKTKFQNTTNINHYTINTDYDSIPWCDLIQYSVCPVNSRNVINTEMAISSNYRKVTYLFPLCDSHVTLKALEIIQALKQYSQHLWQVKYFFLNTTNFCQFPVGVNPEILFSYCKRETATFYVQGGDNVTLNLYAYMFEFMCMILCMCNICTSNFRTNQTIFLQCG